MQATGLVKLIGALFVAHGFSVAWRIALATFLGGVLGAAALLFCYSLVCKKGSLKLNLRREHYYQRFIFVLWVIAIPLLALAAGAVTGTWWAGNHLIKAERLGERLGKSSIRALGAGVAATHLEKSSYAKAKATDQLLKGVRKISLAELSLYGSHQLGQAAAAKLWLHIPFSWPRLMHASAWSVEKTINLFTYVHLGDGDDVVSKLVGSLGEHDRATDGDGLVTLSEILDAVCSTYGDRGVKSMWTALVLQLWLPLLLAILTLLLAPQVLAWAVRRLVSLRAKP